MPNHVLRHAPEHEALQPRVPVCRHDDEVGRLSLRRPANLMGRSAVQDQSFNTQVRIEFRLAKAWQPFVRLLQKLSLLQHDAKVTEFGGQVCRDDVEQQQRRFELSRQRQRIGERFF